MCRGPRSVVHLRKPLSPTRLPRQRSGAELNAGRPEDRRRPRAWLSSENATATSQIFVLWSALFLSSHYKQSGHDWVPACTLSWHHRIYTVPARPPDSSPTGPTAGGFVGHRRLHLHLLSFVPAYGEVCMPAERRTIRIEEE